MTLELDRRQCQRHLWPIDPATMNTFIRKYNSGLLTAGIYLFLVIFALVVTFGN